MPNASDLTAAPEAPAAPVMGWLTTAAEHGRILKRWIGRTASQPKSSRRARRPAWE
ncbi:MULTISPECIES: hypothetical protein [unclassified Caulobacter]|uniref:hypothetical protein n=1 Tax=unclassified Caulobacter TaxID=2648921 RepID=UPI0013048FFA|nr:MULTISPECIES: hypothetical protein [unclassified Caulobacter]